jgi:hypothetical protein
VPAVAIAPAIDEALADTPRFGVCRSQSLSVCHSLRIPRRFQEVGSFLAFHCLHVLDRRQEVSAFLLLLGRSDSLEVLPNLALLFGFRLGIKVVGSLVGISDGGRVRDEKRNHVRDATLRVVELTAAILIDEEQSCIAVFGDGGKTKHLGRFGR